MDVLSAHDDRHERASDEALVGLATRLGRVLFRQDDDLLVIAVKLQRDGTPFAGLVYGHQLTLTIGKAVNDLELLATILEPEEMAGRIEYLPL